MEKYSAALLAAATGLTKWRGILLYYLLYHIGNLIQLLLLRGRAFQVVIHYCFCLYIILAFLLGSLV